MPAPLLRSSSATSTDRARVAHDARATARTGHRRARPALGRHLGGPGSTRAHPARRFAIRDADPVEIPGALTVVLETLLAFAGLAAESMVRDPAGTCSTPVAESSEHCRSPGCCARCLVGRGPDRGRGPGRRVRPDRGREHHHAPAPLRRRRRHRDRAVAAAVRPRQPPRRRLSARPTRHRPAADRRRRRRSTDEHRRAAVRVKRAAAADATRPRWPRSRRRHDAPCSTSCSPRLIDELHELAEAIAVDALPGRRASCSTSPGSTRSDRSSRHESTARYAVRATAPSTSTAATSARATATPTSCRATYPGSAGCRTSSTATRWPAEWHEHTDFFGNTAAYFAIFTRHRTLTVVARSEVEVDRARGRAATTSTRSAGRQARSELAARRRRARVHDRVAARAAVDRRRRIRRPVLRARTRAGLGHGRSRRPHPRRLRVPARRDDGAHDAGRVAAQPARRVPGLRAPRGRLPAVDGAGRALRQRLPRDRSRRPVSPGWSAATPRTPGPRCWSPSSAGSASIRPTTSSSTPSYVITAWGRDYADVPPLSGVIVTNVAAQERCG